MRLTQANLPPKEERGFFVGNFSFKSRSSPSNTQLESAGEIAPLTQKVIWAFWLRAAVLRRTRRNRNAVTNGDGILTDQNFFNQQSNDFLAFYDTKTFGSTVQASKECCESFC